MRRANGTGSIVKLSGNRRRPYLVKISTRDKDGYVRQVALSYHAKLQEAQEALEAYNRKATAGQAPRADMLSWTVGQVYAAWSAREYPRLGLASVTSHKAAWNKRLSRYETEKMRSITLDDWQAILDEGEDEGRSQSSINNDALLIRALNAYAMMRDIIGKDYSAYLDVPTVGIKVKRGSFSDLQVAALEKLAAAGYPGADSALIMCYTGLRVSELLSLTPFSYHPEEGGYLQGGVKRMPAEPASSRSTPRSPAISGTGLPRRAGRPRRSIEPSCSGRWRRSWAVPTPLPTGAGTHLPPVCPVPALKSSPSSGCLATPSRAT